MYRARCFPKSDVKEQELDIFLQAFQMCWANSNYVENGVNRLIGFELI